MGIDLAKKIILFILSLIFIILLLSVANASAKEQRSAEKLLDSLIGYYTHDKKNHIVHATNLGWDFYTDIKYRNFEIAYNFTKIAVEDKHPYAINNFGVMHEEGYAVEKDLNKAFSEMKASWTKSATGEKKEKRLSYWEEKKLRGFNLK